VSSACCLFMSPVCPMFHTSRVLFPLPVVSLCLLSQCLRFPLFMSLRSERRVTLAYFCLGRPLSTLQSVCLYIKAWFSSCECHLKRYPSELRAEQRLRKRINFNLICFVCHVSPSHLDLKHHLSFSPLIISIFASIFLDSLHDSR
jgi:hypothetical protein